MSLSFHTLDVFTDTVFGGNPLAVVLDADELSDADMQRIAREFNLSETAFVLQPGNDAAARRVRIFTPTTELPFAGHPTIGTAVLLVDLGVIPSTGDTTEFVFEEAIGMVAMTVTTRNGRAVSAQLTAAQLPQVTEHTATVDQIAEVLSLPSTVVGADHLEPCVASAGVPFLVVPLSDHRALERIAFDQGAWQRHLAGTDEHSVYVIAVDGDEIRTRMFAPGLGVPEDPATGAAVTALGGYLAAHAPDGAHRWVATQGIQMGRPSRLLLDVEVVGGAATAVRVGGSAVRVADGVMRQPAVGS